MNPNVTLVIGGARSGKSTFAEELASEYEFIHYIATSHSYPDDAEWAHRIAQHKLRRPKSWRVTESMDLVEIVTSATADSCLLIDCLTLWCTRLIDRIDGWNRLTLPGEISYLSEALLLDYESLVAALHKANAKIILVTNEIGQGIVPDNTGARFFRDQLGILNLKVAKSAKNVFQVTAGIPTRLR